MAKQSLLTDLHKHQGAVFVKKEGWLLANHFGNSEAEYQSVRTAVGLIDLAHRALLQFTGPDRLSFLQGMLSNDLPLSGFLGNAERQDSRPSESLSGGRRSRDRRPFGKLANAFGAGTASAGTPRRTLWTRPVAAEVDAARHD